jgi:hypothetical protein
MAATAEPTAEVTIDTPKVSTSKKKTTPKAAKAGAKPAAENAEESPADEFAQVEPTATFTFEKQEISAGELTKMAELGEATPEHNVTKTSLRTASDVRRDDAFWIDPKLIVVNEGENPRVRYSRNEEEWEDFKATIAHHGVRQAIQVYVKRGEGEDKNTLTYHLAQGFRRMRAVRELLAEDPNHPNLKQVPFEKVEYNREKILADHLSLNNGLGLTDMEKTRIVEQMRNWGYKTEDIMVATGLKADKIKQLTEFARKASKKLRQLVENGDISMTKALAFARKNTDQVKQTQKLNAATETLAEIAAEAAAPAEVAAPEVATAAEPALRVNREPEGEQPTNEAPEGTPVAEATSEAPTAAEGTPEVKPEAPAPAPAAATPPKAAPAAKKAPRLDQVLEDIKTVNVERQADKLMSFIGREQEQHPEEIDVEKVNFFKNVMKMIREGKTETDIMRKLFMA